MNPAVPMTCPIEPHEMDKKMLLGMEDVVNRVVCAATMQGVGRDLLLRVYLAGLFHGVELSKRTARASMDNQP